MQNKKVALIHDWLTGMRGGEKVLEALTEIFPGADIFTLLWRKGKVSDKIEQHNIITSPMQKIPSVEKYYRYFLPLMPGMIENFDLKKYDLVVSSSHCVAKGVKVPAGVPHICYCHAPMRYVWDQYDEYFNSQRSNALTSAAMKFVRPYLQRWDIKSASGVTGFIANSKNIMEKIKKYYSAPSQVIYPPVETEGYPPSWDGGYFLMVTALVPYKKVDFAIRAFNELRLPLKIIGSGPDEKRLKSMAGNNIEFTGWLSDDEIKHYYSGCRALIFPQEEDFGITAVEAQAAGKPVIAYGRGGSLETVIDEKTGIFFKEPSVESLKDSVHRFQDMHFDINALLANAERFSHDRFIAEMLSYFEKIYSQI